MFTGIIEALGEVAQDQPLDANLADAEIEE